MSVNPNGEAETLKIYLKPRPRLKKLIDEFAFGDLAIKGRGSAGNLLTRYAIHKIVLKERGASTLSGQNIWWDSDIRRLNSDGRGDLLGEFVGGDKVVVFTRSNTYYTTTYDTSQHFPEDVERVGKWDNNLIYTVVYVDTVQNLHYIKRFTAELSDNKPQAYLDGEGLEFVSLNTDRFPALELTYGGRFQTRPVEMIDADDFIGVKSHRAKGKRLSTLELSRVAFLEPLVKEVFADDSLEDDMLPQLAQAEEHREIVEEGEVIQGELF